METDSPVVYHGTSESRFPPESREKPHLQLNPEEIRVLRECNRESFYYRCLPFAAVGIAATYLGFKQGYLKGHHKWGPAGKMTGAAFVGWIIGKFSYRNTCEDKFLRLENSAIGNAVRKRRGLLPQTYENEGIVEEDMTVKPNEFRSSGENDYHSSVVPYSGLDDRNRPTTDKETTSYPTEGEPVKKFTTYDELRQKNRQQYEQQNRSQSKTNLSQIGGSRQWGRTSNEQNEGPLGGGSRNAYGDTWDNPKFT